MYAETVEPFFDYSQVEKAREHEERLRHSLWTKGIALAVVVAVWLFFSCLSNRKIKPSRAKQTAYRLGCTVVVFCVLGAGGYALYLWLWGDGVPTQLVAGIVASLAL